MPRRERPAKTERSEHWLRVAVNERTEQLNELIERKFGWSTKDPITWLSPLKSDDYAEYYDEAFLERVGLSALKAPLAAFWPRSGPRWDGLGRTSTGRVLLVEAKAYIEEGVDYRSGAKAPDSVDLIRQSLAVSKKAFGVNEAAPWDAPFYQYANRLAHLHFLNSVQGNNAYLLFLYFADAPDVPEPCTVEQWEGAERLTRKCLGLGKEHPYSDRVATLIWSVSDMLAGKSE